MFLFDGIDSGEFTKNARVIRLDNEDGGVEGVLLLKGETDNGIDSIAARIEKLVVFMMDFINSVYIRVNNVRGKTRVKNSF